MAIVKTVKIIDMKSQTSDYNFWKTKSFQERLDALEQIRKEYHQWKHNAQPGLQRVYSIIERQ